jgi:tetratricopeptide (TPR) repeat protein
VVALFFLSLIAKPMMVLLPVLLLLLDFWPLGRFQTRSLKALLDEKFPCVAMALALGATAILAQKSNITGLDAVSFGSRAAYALVSPVFYLGKLLWPAGLAFTYPVRSQPYPLWLVFLAPCLAAAATWWAVRERHRFPWALVGWVWYLVILMPVSGVVQAGLTIVMDRVVYVPALGIYLLVAGWLCEALPPRGGRQGAIVVMVWLLGITALIVVSARQIGFWQDDRTLFGRTVAVAPDSVTGHWNLATVLLERGEEAQALEHALTAQRLAPGKGEMAYNVGLVFDNLGRYAEAVDEYRKAIALGEKGARVQEALGVALGSLGRNEEGLVHLREARRLDPSSGEDAYNLGVALLRLGRPTEAMVHLREALRSTPGDHRVLFNLGVALQQAGLPAEAADRFAEVIRLKPELAAAHRQLGLSQELLGQRAQAADSYRAALALDPGDTAAGEGLARLRAGGRR